MTLYVVPIGDDGHRGPVTAPHPRSLVAWHFARTTEPVIEVNGIRYERVPEPQGATS